MISDLVLVNANILTMNPANPRAEAVAVKEDRILKVGKNADVTSLIGKNTKVLDLQGKTILPGFIDTHIHIADFGRTLTWLDLKNVDSIKTLQDKIRQHAQAMSKGKWLLGSGWNQDNFAEKRYPTRQDLDEASPDNPVILYHQLGRTCIANTKALEIASITKDTTPPKDGAIDKNPETSELTGILHGNATDLIWNKIPAPTEKETLEATRHASEKIVEAGITSVHWIICQPAELSIAQKLARENLPLRTYIIITANLLDNLPNPEHSENQNPNSVKVDAVLVFADGYLASETAALNEPYSDNPATKGTLLYTQEELNKLVKRIHRANLQVIVHATGDKAVDAALKALEAIPPKKLSDANRYRLEQAAVLNKQLIQRIKKQNLIVSAQPRVIESEFTVWSATEHLGNKRARLLFPIRTLLNKGVLVVGGSDCPMEPLNPLTGIQTAATRKFFPNERITVEDALRIYTINAAHATSEEHLKGSIEEEKLADLTVLSNDPTSVALNKLTDIEVEMTIIGGKIIYQKQSE
jgi:hypothetical protein